MEKDAFRIDAVSEVVQKAEMTRGEKRDVGRAVLGEVKNEQDSAGESGRRAEEIKDEPVETRFHVDEKEFPIFAQQTETYLIDKDTVGHRKWSIDRTLGTMVGSTARTIEALTGEKAGLPKADHVIYLDKSARPVSWLVDEFWDDFTDEKRPERTFLAIDRRIWLQEPFIEGELKGYDYTDSISGERRRIEPRDFKVERVPREMLAGIRALYVEGGVDTEDPEEIFKMPTVLDGKNATIVDEVSQSGMTLYIASELLKAAVPEANSVNGYVFWDAAGHYRLSSGEMQTSNSPVWYPEDPSDSTGRGVKDINEAYYRDLYAQEPTRVNLALKLGARVLGEPLEKPEEEPGQRSLRLREEIARMRQEYDAGHILPNSPLEEGKVSDRYFEKFEELGVEFAQPVPGKRNPRLYQELVKKRDQAEPVR